MKFIFLTILATIIIFFVWNILKRIFFKEFYKNAGNQQFEKQQKTDKKINQKVNWDAETVDYEEVKDDQKKQQ